ncbi:MAG TPA: CaiB/BaiF CoA-transferase family protein [Bryobacteraceae bacterium]|nr:CaiB/BaiF CoA-transferase family protein [Bryobacteraceae bacterium]
MSFPEANLPLSGIRVVALEQAVSAPFCSRQCADLGADVIKVERPDGGDFARSYDSDMKGLSGHFAWLNRGKRSIALDLKREADCAAFGKLIDRADVFVHNLSPGAVERLGFGCEACRARNPRLIWCGISGYGPDGPYRDKKAYDLLVQAESGVVSLTGSPEAAAKVGVSIADINAGMYAYSSILAALLQRDRSGEGERIDISMLECLVEWATPQMYMYQGAGRVPARVGIRHSGIVPYGAYACADGLVTFAIQNQREWRRLCETVFKNPGLAADPRYATNADRLQNRATLEAWIEQCFSNLTGQEIVERMERADIANAVLNDIPAVVAHPQLAARGRWREADSPVGAIPALLPPHNLQHAPPRMGRIPALGEHTKDILAELGLDK